MTNELPPVTIVKGDPHDDEVAALVASLMAAASAGGEDDDSADRERHTRVRWRNSLRQDYASARAQNWRW